MIEGLEAESGELAGKTTFQPSGATQFEGKSPF